VCDERAFRRARRTSVSSTRVATMAHCTKEPPCSPAMLAKAKIRLATAAGRRSHSHAPSTSVCLLGPVTPGGSPCRTYSLSGSHLGHALLGHWAGIAAPAVLLARSRLVGNVRITPVKRRSRQLEQSAMATREECRKRGVLARVPKPATSPPPLPSTA
jgi:hypothetical protein